MRSVAQRERQPPCARTRHLYAQPSEPTRYGYSAMPLRSAPYASDEEKPGSAQHACSGNAKAGDGCQHLQAHQGSQRSSIARDTVLNEPEPQRPKSGVAQHCFWREFRDRDLRVLEP